MVIRCPTSCVTTVCDRLMGTKQYIYIVCQIWGKHPETSDNISACHLGLQKRRVFVKKRNSRGVKTVQWMSVNLSLSGGLSQSDCRKILYLDTECSSSIADSLESEQYI